MEENELNKDVNIDIDRIKTGKNRVFYAGGLGVGKNNPISLHTSSSSVYRVTGMSQIADIINCGYVRPREGHVKGGHVNEIFWAIGGEKSFYYDKRPVLEVSAEKVMDGQVGSLSIDDLSSVWIFDEPKNKYENKISIIRQIREFVKESGYNITEESLVELLSRQSQNGLSQNQDELNEQKLERFLKLRELERQRVIQLRQQQFINTDDEQLSSEGKTR